MHLAPDIFAFDDHKTFLQAWYEWKKATNPRYSHRLFARRAGRAGDAGLLRNLITGRRALTRALVDDLGTAMELTPIEVEQLALLASLGRVRGSEREAAAHALLVADSALRRAERRRCRVEQYLTTWYVPVVRELARMEPFLPSAEWIAGRVVPPITVDEASHALGILHELGHLDEQGRLIENAQGDWNRRREDHEDLTYQQDLHATAGRALAHVAQDPTYRRSTKTTGMVVAVSKDKVAALQAELDAVRQRLTQLADGDEEPETVLQVVLQAFPVVAEPQG